MTAKPARPQGPKTTRPASQTSNKVTPPTSGPALNLSNYQLFLVLALVNVVTRLPFVSRFDMVTFDGTYYVNQAKSILQGAFGGGSFPVGYPAFIAAVIPFARDGVIAAQIVSFLAGVGTTIALYLLAARFISRPKAFLCALILAVHPLFIRLSLLTYSESLYLCWVVLALVFYAANRNILFGIAMGVAVITRPEALAIFALLMLLKIRQPRWIAAAFAAFVVLYTLNIAYLSQAMGRVVLLPKSEFFGTGAQLWQLREHFTEFEGKEDAQKTLVETSDRETRLSSYVKRLPLELRSLHQLVLPVLIVLAAFGAYKRRTFVLAALLPFVFIPAFTVRAETRYLLPYVPVLILYGFIGAEAITRKNVRAIAYGLIALSALLTLGVNQDQLQAAPEPEYRGSKEAGRQFRNAISPTDKIADRKPFFAFYAGGDYVEIPLAPYEGVMDFLVKENVRLLSLHMLTTHNYRPVLRPLLYDRAAIMGELRYKQVYAAPTGELIYEKVRDDDPLHRRPLGDFAGEAMDPCWSPDGSRIAFRGLGTDGRPGIYVASADGTSGRRLTEAGPKPDPLSWSPDGKRIAFAWARDENADIYAADVGTGRVSRLTSGPANDFSPSWAPNGKEIVFCSDRSGAFEIWIIDLDSGRTTQVTTSGESRFPMFSNDGSRIAWLSKTDAVILERATSTETRIRGSLRYRPVWSPDDRFIAMESFVEGNAGIHLLAVDGSAELLLTKGVEPTGMPGWGPRRDEIAVVSKVGGRLSLWVLGGLEAYLERLQNPPEITIFTRPVEPTSQ
jgi:TolB protein